MVRMTAAKQRFCSHWFKLQKLCENSDQQILNSKSIEGLCGLYIMWI